jgi:HSP20 family protein
METTKMQMKESKQEKNDLECVVPRCDIRESTDQYILLIEMPGVKKDSLKVKINNDTLLIDGTMKLAEMGKLVRAEIPSRNYRRIFSLSETVDRERIDAKWEDGILVLQIGKKEAAKPRNIEIKFN